LACIATIANTFYFTVYLDVLESVLCFNYKQKQYWNLIAVFLSNIYFSHIMCVILFAASYFDINNNWLIKYHAEDYIWYEKYFIGFYYATSIITTTGFGDITVANPYECLLVAGVMLFGCMILSFNISRIGNILSNLREADS
jgi:hypothetical protein